MSRSTILFLLSAASSLASSITWSDCKVNTSLPVTCASLAVPLDYTDANSNKTIILNMVRLPATQQPSKGSILVNPGGPGEGGRNFVLETGEALSLITGPEYDLIGFDPRGTGETIPFSCYATAIERDLAAVLSPQQLTDSDVAPGLSWATNRMLAARCYETAGNIGELIGTGFVARDMMQIVDALGEDGLLRYYGFSYGTALGATVAAMFPDRMDKVVLDGVLNIDQYYSGSGTQELLDTDSVYEGFFTGCIASPELCPLAKHGVSAANLSNTVSSLLEQVKYNPIPLGPTLPTDLVTYEALKTSIFQALYAPASWPALASLLDAALVGNLTAYVEAYLEVSGLSGSARSLFPEKQGAEALQGIRCADSQLRAKNLSDIEPLLQQYEATSYAVGAQEPIAVTIPCVQWKMKAKGAYNGSFSDVKTKNPLLFVGNTHDPLTPLASAMNTSAGFQDSRVLTVNAYGHTSIAQPSLCAARAIGAYFANGTMPDPGTICQPSVALFPPPSASLGSILQPLNHTKRADGDEDMRLLRALGRVHRGRVGRAKLF